MTKDKFQIVGDSLSGRGLSFDLVGLVTTEPNARGTRLIEIAEVSYLQGRASALLSWDGRFDLHHAVEALRALAVILGPCPTGDRHRHAADLIARLLQDQEGGT